MSSKVEPPNTPMQQALLPRAHCFTPALEGMEESRPCLPWHFFSSFPPLHYPCVSPSRGSSDEGDETSSPQSLSQGSHCPLMPVPPLWGQMGFTNKGSPPTTSLHGEPMPPLQQDSSWTPPGNICFRLECPSAHRELTAPARVMSEEDVGLAMFVFWFSQQIGPRLQ